MLCLFSFCVVPGVSVVGWLAGCGGRVGPNLWIKYARHAGQVGVMRETAGGRECYHVCNGCDVVYWAILRLGPPNTVI